MEIGENLRVGDPMPEEARQSIHKEHLLRAFSLSLKSRVGDFQLSL
jgi:hypothetical protein